MIGLCITGGGTAAIGEFLKHGGKSSVLAEAIVPYTQEAMDQYLGRAPDKYCSGPTACQMAMRAFERVVKLKPEIGPGKIVGVGCTAALKTENDRVGRTHKYYLAVQTVKHTKLFSADFHSVYSRERQEAIVAGQILNFLEFGDFEGSPYIYESYNNEWAEPGECLYVYTSPAPSYVVLGNPLYSFKNHPPYMVLSSSCNPFHNGHKAMVEYCRTYFPGYKIFCEISINNFEKPTIDYISLRNRIASIPTNIFDGIIISNVPDFNTKEKIYPNANFIIGNDTFERMDMKNKYGYNNCVYLIFPRNGKLPNRASLPNAFMSVSQFNQINISSTELRNAKH